LNLTEDGDYWEQQIRLKMSDWIVDDLERGETANATLYARFSLEEYDANHTRIFVPDIGGPTVGITVFRPFLSTAETYVVGGVGSVMTFGLLALGLHKAGRLPLCRWGYHDWRDYGDRVVVRWREQRVLEDPSHPHPVDKSRKEDTVVSGRRCQYCGVHQQRKFIENEDGELEVAGWENVDSGAGSEATGSAETKQ
jgi:hypothetical protein